MKTRRTWVALAAVGALGVGTLSIPAFAQDDDVPATRAETPQTDEATISFRQQTKERAKEIFAAELGVSVEELEAAKQATREQIQEEFADEFEARREQRQARLLEHVDRALENGRITEDEAETLRQRTEDGEHPFGRVGRGFGRGHHVFGGPGGGDRALFDGGPLFDAEPTTDA